ncbi:AzlD domain-containing protein [Marinobacterium mangrovicola]|uniref:Branched-subunit amino acid transport protein n=1 Tax=Marinobacterium mangrovicola TaxID=1476959 RepID=A0A4R1G8K8_9GAMM|nr:AzlD domain-containing protein [Marinobacterium mangrovicola]TCK04184.1 branched-subunit amino acid transport protein [Marinobacterium mangrovicola]
MSDLALWSLFVAVGIGTFALRFSFIGLHGRLHIPPLLKRALAYVPASVLAALVVPAVTLTGPDKSFAFDNLQIPAAIIAALVAWKSRNTLLTLLAGMGSLWLLQAIF